MPVKILTIYPRFLFTSAALFDGTTELRRGEIRHDNSELCTFERVADQWPHRLRAIEELISQWTVDDSDLHFDAVIGPAGIPQKKPDSVYEVNDGLISILNKSRSGEHPTDLSAVLCDGLARSRKAKAFVLASISREEFDPISRVTGIPELTFGRLMHIFNIGDVAYSASEALSLSFNKLSVVVAYLGSSFSICAMKNGRVLDLTNANERGPFSPARSGAVPAADIIRMAYSGQLTMSDFVRKVNIAGGVESYAGTHNFPEILERAANGDTLVNLVLRSMAYQIAQEIAAQSTVLKGRVDAIVLTGRCVNEQNAFVQQISERVHWITDKILIFPGENAHRTLANSAYRVLAKNEKALVFERN